MTVALWCVGVVLLLPYLLSQAPRTSVDALALAFVVCRVLHAAFYISDRALLRSHAWRVGMICIVALFVVAGVQGQR
jgi:uncharacterized MAPEG superfamily protein